MWKAKGRLCRILFAGFVGTFIAASSWSALAAEAWKLPDSGIIMADKEKQAYVAEKMGKIFQPATNTPKATNEQVPKSNFAAPDGWEYTVFSLGDLSVEQLNNPFATSKRTVLQFHGGGYINSLGDGHRLFCVKQMVLTDAKAGYIVDYRTAPEYTYPSALEDAVRAYEGILSKGTVPKDIVVFGDSAGGNLALELSLYLREHNMPQPGAMVLASPWATFETDLPSRKQNADRDLILGKINPRMYNEILNPSYGKGLSAKDVHLSPMYADLAGLPPMLIQAGGYELFLDESIALAQKAAGDGTDVTLTVYPGMSHDFALLLPELDDSVKSFKEIRDFVNRHMDKL